MNRLSQLIPKHEISLTQVLHFLAENFEGVIIGKHPKT